MKSFDKKVLCAFVFGLIAFSVMVGCSNSSSKDNKPEVDSEREELIAHPKITQVNNIDGCDVKYVETYRRELLYNNVYRYNPSNFYISSCEGKSTTTTTVGNDKFHTLTTVIQK